MPKYKSPGSILIRLSNITRNNQLFMDKFPVGLCRFTLWELLEGNKSIAPKLPLNSIQIWRVVIKTVYQ